MTYQCKIIIFFMVICLILAGCDKKEGSDKRVVQSTSGPTRVPTATPTTHPKTTHPKTTPSPGIYRTLPEDEEIVFMEKLRTLTCDEIKQIIWFFFCYYSSHGEYSFPNFEKYGFAEQDFTKDLVKYYIRALREKGCCINLYKECYCMPEGGGLPGSNIRLFTTAVKEGYDELALYFLECGNPPLDKRCGMMGACNTIYYFPIYVRRGNYEMVSYFVKYGLSDEGFSQGLYAAIESGNSVILRFLLDNSADSSQEKSIWYDDYDIFQESLDCMERQESTTPVEDDGYTGLTPLYHALLLDKKDIAEILLDYGADPSIQYKKYIFRIEFNEPEGFDMESEVSIEDHSLNYYNTVSNSVYWDYTATVTFIQSPLDLAKSNRYYDLVAKMLNPLECIPLEKNTAALVKERWEKKEFTSLAAFLGDIKDRSYCTSGRDLMRNACYWTATDFYTKKDFNTAIALFRRAITYTVSNTELINDPVELEKADLPAWEKEGDGDAPGYYCAYNIACAYSLLGKIEEGFQWLEIAFRMNPKIKEIAKKDSDLEALREQVAAPWF